MTGTENIESCTLEYEIAGEPKQRVLSQSVVTMGRAANCDMVFPDSVAGMSRHHATLLALGGKWRVKDAGSRNGTFVNQLPVAEQTLKDGDVINLGPLAIVFRMGDATSKNEPKSTRLRQQAESSVRFEDGPAPNVSMSIDLTSMLRMVGSGGESGSVGAGRLESLEATAVPIDEDGPLSSVGGASGSLGIELFSRLGEALAKTDALEQMLEGILDLVFQHVPAQRGLICLIDDETNELIPQAMKIRGRDPSEKSSVPFGISRSIADEAIRMQRSLLVGDATSDLRFAEAKSIHNFDIKAAMCVPLYNKGNVDGLIYVDTVGTREPFLHSHLELVTAMSLFSAVALEQARLREEIEAEQAKRQRLSRYHPAAVVEQILARADDEEMMAEDRVVSVLFADLCGFTTLSEKLAPADVVRLLNQVFEMLSECVFLHKGTLDKFMGDGMLAFFGAPLEQPQHALHAVKAALQMQLEIQRYNAANPDQPDIGIRVGINSGPAVVGDIGSLTRKDYTVIGDTVNVASRLESSVAKPGQVVMGPGTQQLVSRKVVSQPLIPIQLKGRVEPVTPYLAIRVRSEYDTNEFDIAVDS